MCSRFGPAEVRRMVVAFGLLAVTAPGAQGDDREKLKPILDKAAKAGGGEKLVGLKAWALTTKTESPDGSRGTVRLFCALPDKYRQEVTVEKGKGTNSVMVMNGDKAWLALNDKPAKELFPSSVSSLRIDLLEEGVRRPLAAANPAYRLTALGESKVGDRTVVGLAIVGDRLSERRQYLDTETGRVLKAEEIFLDAKRKALVTEFVYSDFREVGGVTVPWKWVASVDGKKVSEGTVTEFDPAPKFDDKLFTRP